MICCEDPSPEAEDIRVEHIKGTLPVTETIPFAELTRSTVFLSKTISGTKYDVFINHRGKDVKDTIASLVYHNLSNRNLKVFLDNKEMEHGEAIPHKIHHAIRTASVHIAFFSENYAESVWCLSELSLAEESGAPIIPIFCGVQPSDLRMKSDNEVGLYAKAFHKLHQTVDSESIEKWRATLHRVSYRFGFKFEGDYGMLLENIAASVMKHIKKACKFEGEEVVLHTHKRTHLEVDSKGRAIAEVDCQMKQSSCALQVSSENIVTDLLSKVEQGKRYRIQEIGRSCGNQIEFEFHTDTPSSCKVAHNDVLEFQLPDSNRSTPSENLPNPQLIDPGVHSVDQFRRVKDLNGKTIGDKEGAPNRGWIRVTRWRFGFDVDSSLMDELFFKLFLCITYLLPNRKGGTNCMQIQTREKETSPTKTCVGVFKALMELV